MTVQEEVCCLKPMPDSDNRWCARHGGKQRGAVTLTEEQVGNPIRKLHCIKCQENLSANMSNSDLNKVTATVVKIVHFIVKGGVSSICKHNIQTGPLLQA